MTDIVPFPREAIIRTPPVYKGPRINKKKRKLAIETILQAFDPKGVRACMIIGIPYDKNQPYAYLECGGDPEDWRNALEDMRDLIKFPPEDFDE